jgi:predicted Zn-dependent protease with MMP-like domain
MAISYKVVDKSTRVNTTGSFGRLMENASNVLQEQNVSIVNNKTFRDEVLLDEAAWETYKDALLQECDESDKAAISDLLESTRIANIEGMTSILGEAATNLDVFTTFTFPLIRNIWPRTAMKYAAITTVVKKPTFNISYIMPQLIRDGKTYDLNEITEGDQFKGFVYCPSLYDGVIKLEDFDITQVIDGSSVTNTFKGAGTVEGFDLVESVPGIAASRVNGSGIDTNIRIKAIEVADGSESKLIENLSIMPDLRGFFNYTVSWKNASDETVSDTIIGRVDFAEGKIYLKSLADLVTGFKVAGRLSPEYNLHTDSITYATRNDEFRIPIGAHLNAPVTQELLTDTQALFQIDGAAKIIEIMGEAFSQMLDIEYKEAFIDEAYACGGKFVIDRSFDCKPIPTFMGSPADWRESLKTVINHAASTLKTASRFSGGKFVILGNDVDIDLITNVSWTFTGNTGAEKSGVATEYRIGAFAGLHNYEVVGVQNRIPQGAIYIVYLSEDDRQMTNRYFPYTFNVCESKYLDPNRPYVPNIMMSKRHLMHRFRNMVAKIAIYNNTGSVNHFTNYDAAGNVIEG